MAVDSEGVLLQVGQTVYYDDGVSPDWAHGVVSHIGGGTNAPAMITIDLPGGVQVVKQAQYIHVTEPTAPPDR